MSDNNINKRKMQILRAIISDYVSTGEPVGSRTLAKKYDLGISSATIRNEMSDLEEMGYLEQPHTSSGRVPSSKGYRKYVDELMDLNNFSDTSLMKMCDEIIDFASFEIDKILKSTSIMLSELTNMAIIAEKPNVRNLRIQSIQIVSLGNKTIMVVVVLENSTFKNTIVKLKKDPEPQELLSISNYFTIKLSSKNLNNIDIEFVEKLRKEKVVSPEIIDSVIKAVFSALEEEGEKYIVEGKKNILNYPEFNDVVKAKEVFNILDNPLELIHKIDYSLDSTNNEDFRILIGDELELPENNDWTVISAKYKLDGVEVGTINLVGPKRLDYSKVTNILSTVVSELNKKLNNKSEDDDG